MHVPVTDNYTLFGKCYRINSKLFQIGNGIGTSQKQNQILPMGNYWAPDSIDKIWG